MLARASGKCGGTVAPETPETTKDKPVWRQTQREAPGAEKPRNRPLVLASRVCKSKENIDSPTDPP